VCGNERTRAASRPQSVASGDDSQAQTIKNSRESESKDAFFYIAVNGFNLLNSRYFPKARAALRGSPIMVSSKKIPLWLFYTSFNGASSGFIGGGGVA
jgi:hypothetical protein